MLSSLNINHERTGALHEMNRRISVVIAAYNGVKFLREQLDSIYEQILKPDEVIIADDFSDDGTFDFCRKYIDDRSLHGWTVYRNAKNLGVSRNFREALRHATGDYVFTCDQDDIWMPDKISAMAAAMNDNPAILLLASNYIPFRDSEKIAHSYVKNLARDDGEIIPLRLKDYWLGNLRPGCTFCFRREIIDRFSVMDIDTRLHDSMLWKYAIVADGLYLMCRQLVLYRRHDSNATNQFRRTPPNISQRVKNADIDAEMCRKFLDASDGLAIPEHNRKALRRMIHFLSRRKKILEGRNPVIIAVFVLLNLRYYQTFRNALSDIYAAIKLRD